MRPIARAAEFVKPNDHWTATDFRAFLLMMPEDAMASLLTQSGVSPRAYKTGDRPDEIRAIQCQLLWQSSNLIAYYFRDETQLPYHDLVVWVAKSCDVKSPVILAKSTFHLEREIEVQAFAKAWDALSPEQRLKLLHALEQKGLLRGKDGATYDKAGLALLGGAAIIGALGTSVAFMGFSFYITMSVTISTLAGIFGLTLPFAAYTGASSLIAFLAGPVGAAIAAALLLGGLFTLGGLADATKAYRIIGATHALKVDALLAAGVAEHAVFSS